MKFLHEEAEKLRAAAALEDWSYHFEERAGIIEEGDQVPRKEAELRAFLEVIYEYLSLHHPIVMEQMQTLIAYAQASFDQEPSLP